MLYCLIHVHTFETSVFHSVLLPDCLQKESLVVRIPCYFYSLIFSVFESGNTEFIYMLNSVALAYCTVIATHCVKFVVEPYSYCIVFTSLLVLPIRGEWHIMFYDTEKLGILCLWFRAS